MQVVLEHNLPIDELKLVHEHDLRGLFDVAQNGELVEEIVISLEVFDVNET